ncbi:MAG: LPS export ABC transporter periplasmic protein LptC [Bacteroidota bacterium]|nr:LPS export ABC transporter periplasmic protein LptC [Bacteroidota bacterium]
MKRGSSSVNYKRLVTRHFFVVHIPLTRIAVALCVTVILFLSFSCQKERKEFVPSFIERDSIPGLYTDSVTTLISDSGRIRYKVITAVWKIFDKAPEPYWLFPDKVYCERFNDSMKVESLIQCDTARYFTRRRLWELKKNVRIVNLKGETFKTSILYWDQRQDRVYSDSFIRIEQKDVVLSGTGFTSNQTLTRYTIFKPKGPIYMDQDKKMDSLKMDPYRKSK